MVKRKLRLMGDTLTLTVGKQATAYTLRRIGSHTFQLRKSPSCSYVCDSDGCTCLGFRTHRKCKHRDAIRKLTERNLLIA